MTDLKSLIAELERAKEGSRKLDAKISAYLRPALRNVADQFINGPSRAVRLKNIDAAMRNMDIIGAGEEGWFVLTELNEDGKWIGYSRPPHYTDSLDAAVALVPEECWWNVNGDGRACVLKPSDGMIFGRRDKDRNADAATLALALCIAALKARDHG